MNKKSSALVAVVLATSFVAFSNPAHAVCNETTVYGRIQTGYVFQDIGVMGTDEPVFQGGITRSCESGWWFDLWNSTGLSTKGDYGQADERDYADELDFTVGKNGKVETTLGAFKYEVFASYYALADLNRWKDDVVEVHLDFARESFVGKGDYRLTIAPYVRITDLLSMGGSPDVVLVLSGLRATITVTERLSLKTDLGIGFDVKEGRDIRQSETGIYYNISPNVSVNVGMKTAEGVNPVALIGFSKTF